MKNIKEITDWLDGKKTIIGAAIDFVVGVIALFQNSFGVQFITPDQLSQAHDFALFIITIGLAHKVIKKA